MQIVPFAVKERVRLHVDHDVQVAWLPASRPRMSFARHADARAVAQAGRDVDRDRFSTHFRLLAAARWTSRIDLTSGTVALRAWLREHHVAAGRLQRAGSLAIQAAPFRG